PWAVRGRHWAGASGACASGRLAPGARMPAAPSRSRVLPATLALHRADTVRQRRLERIHLGAGHGGGQRPHTGYAEEYSPLPQRVVQPALPHLHGTVFNACMPVLAIVGEPAIGHVNAEHGADAAGVGGD